MALHQRETAVSLFGSKPTLFILRFINKRCFSLALNCLSEVQDLMCILYWKIVRIPSCTYHIFRISANNIVRSLLACRLRRRLGHHPRLFIYIPEEMKEWRRNMPSSWWHLGLPCYENKELQHVDQKYRSPRNRV